MERKQLVAPKASEDNAVELFYFLRSTSTCLEGEKNKKKSFPAAPPVYLFLIPSYLILMSPFRHVLRELLKQFDFFFLVGWLFFVWLLFLNTATGQRYCINKYVLSPYITIWYDYTLEVWRVLHTLSSPNRGHSNGKTLTL